MRVEHFRYLFNNLNGFYLKKHWIFFRKPVELWNEETGESAVFKSVDEALGYSIEGETVLEIINKLDSLFVPSFNGGRGAAGGGGKKTFKFNHAPGGGGGEQLPPAYANTKIKSKTPEGAISEFNKRHKMANREWAFELDDQGFVHQYVKGAAHSVAIGGSNTSRNRKTTIIHNHPSGGHFSDADLLSTAMDRRSTGIIASPKGKNYVYKFEKGTHFKANEFSKAVKNAKIQGNSYDDAVDKWLKKNSKKYGYKYSKVKA